ncbi:unnamed protein product [Eruca vesicaria subsp. sativa]|uniref:Quinolinate phosphoribosyl transferase C-terminal domain-containing protein n=1 Tax=Eruca vesicaria subsp. sativa TaxID=29727 RepID=A0ABC8KQP7_ERUVS|nr:unnamed protein product [Eruca vesicaria subsp. sativa]
MEVEAYFLAKEDGTFAGTAIAQMIFEQVDPSLKVLTGGGKNHKMGLFDKVMIKDKHLAAGGIVDQKDLEMDLGETQMLEEVKDVCVSGSKSRPELVPIRNGICKFVPACKFDHSMSSSSSLSYTMSASPLSYMCVMPYPLRSSLLRTLAPLSSNDQNTEIHSSSST